jgi:CelD/BcsL family acetyltransferase involved in cellulose biosynthesis
VTATPVIRPANPARRTNLRARDAAGPGAGLVGFDELTADEIEAWHRLRAANPALDSPYFHPGFAAAVHASGAPVTVVVARDGTGAVTALMAGHRHGACLYPVGWPGADFQAPIAAPGEPAAPLQLLPRGIREARFDHLISPGAQFEPYIVDRQASPLIDTTGGLDGYLRRASRSGKENMGQARRRAAKAEREIGPVRFHADAVDEAALAAVIALKRAQYAATGARDYFAPHARLRPPGFASEDRVALMSRLLHTREPDFSGVLSTVHIGDRLVAAHFGIRSGPVLHWWFPVFDPAYAHLAPGWILLRELVAAAPRMGVHRIDLGRGDDEYKRRAKTGETLVCQASLTRSATVRLVRRVRHHAVRRIRSSPLGPALRAMVHRLRAPGTGPADGQRHSTT